MAPRELSDYEIMMIVGLAFDLDVAGDGANLAAIILRDGTRIDISADKTARVTRDIEGARD